MNLQALSVTIDLWAKEQLFLEEHRTALSVLESAVDIYLQQLYKDLSFHDLLKQGASSDQLSRQLKFEESAPVALQPMLLRLSDRYDFLEQDNSDEQTVFISQNEPDIDTEQLALYKKTLTSLGVDYIAPMEFLEFGYQHFKHSMQEDFEFMDRVLTGQEKAHNETWHRATNTDPLQDIHGILGAKVLQELFDGGSILEIGGGTGNGLKNNLDRLQQTGQIAAVNQYLFTDVSMPFIVNTKHELNDRYPKGLCKYQLLNINKDWQQQRINASSQTFIYGVNAAHIAQRLIDFLHECLTTLEPGGCVVFSERIRQTAVDMAPREIVLNQSRYHRTAAQRHPDYRPAHAYLTRDNWLKACEIAGFSEVVILPSTESVMDYFPEQYAAVIVAKK